MAARTFAQGGYKTLRRGSVVNVLQYFSAAAITAGTNKIRWPIMHAGRILGAVATAGGAGVGAGSSVIDINKNGTTIFAAATKLTIATADTDYFDVSRLDPAQVDLKPGDIVSLDVDSIPATTGHVVVHVAVYVGGP